MMWGGEAPGSDSRKVVMGNTSFSKDLKYSLIFFLNIDFTKNANYFETRFYCHFLIFQIYVTFVLSGGYRWEISVLCVLDFSFVLHQRFQIHVLEKYLIIYLFNRNLGLVIF